MYRSDSIEPTILPINEDFSVSSVYTISASRPLALFLEAASLDDKIAFEVILDIAKPFDISRSEEANNDAMKKYFFSKAKLERHGSDWLVMSGFGSIVLNTLSVILPFFNIGGGPLEAMSTCLAEEDTIGAWKEIERVELLERIHELVTRHGLQTAQTAQMIAPSIARAVCDILQIADIPDDVVALFKV